MFRSREKVVCWSLKRYDHFLLSLIIEMCWSYGCDIICTATVDSFQKKMQRRDTLFAVVDFEYFASIFYVSN